MKFITYVPCERGKVEFEVTAKIRTDVRGHLTYMLTGLTAKGHKACALVNKSQWDNFDVPIEEREVPKKVDRKRMRNKSMQPAVGRKTPIPKSQKRVYNEDIEKWLADHYDINLDDLKENEQDER